MTDWQPSDPLQRPFDFAHEAGFARMRGPQDQHTTEELLRILAANGFKAPVFEQRMGAPIQTVYRRCMVIGPDGERHDAARILPLIFKAERLERLCQDRSDVVMGMLARQSREGG
jgi:hypothetical protein